MNEHESIREMLARRSELTTVEESRLRAHLEGCPECRQAADEYAQQTALLRALPTVAPPATLRASVLRDVGARRSSPLLRLRQLGLMAAPAAVLAAAVVFAFTHGSSSTPSTALGPHKQAPAVTKQAAPSQSDARHGKPPLPQHRHVSPPPVRRPAPVPTAAPGQAPIVSQQLPAAPSAPGPSDDSSSPVVAPPTLRPAHKTASTMRPSPVQTRPTAAPPIPAPTSRPPPAVSTVKPTPPVITRPVTTPATVTAPSSPPPASPAPVPTP